MENAINKLDLLQAIEIIKFRTEKQVDDFDNLNSFVPLIDFSTLATSNTQIIYGRNGTGKTHLLKAFYESCERDFEENKVLPVYIDLKDLELGPVLPSLSIDDLIIRFYRRFFFKIIKRLEDFTDKVITTHLLEKLFRGQSVDKKRKIGKSIKNLYSLLNMQQIEELMKDYERKVESDKEGLNKRSANASLASQLSLSKISPSIDVGFGLSTEDVEKEKETIELVYKGLSVVDYEKIRGEFENLISYAGAKAIIILVDEWSSLSLRIQPLFSEMIRKTLGVSNKIFLKIVGLKYFTKMSDIVDPPQRIGMQTGVDINLLVDLDHILNYDIDAQNVKDFLTRVAYEHTSLTLPSVKNTSIKDFEDFLCSEIFEDTSVYLEIVRASEGNPRDFLGLLSSCCIEAKIKPEKKVLFRQAVRIASNYYTNNKVPEIRSNAKADNLYDVLVQKAVQNCQKLFLISRRKAEKDDRLQELLNYRFIHLVNSNFTLIDDGVIQGEYIAFSMDYGKLITLKVQEAGKQIVEAMTRMTELLLSQDLVVLSRLHVADLYALSSPLSTKNAQYSLCSTSIKLSKSAKAFLAKKFERNKTVIWNIHDPTEAIDKNVAEWAADLNKRLNERMEEQKIEAATNLVAAKGVEVADINDILFLIKNCIYDDLL